MGSWKSEAFLENFMRKTARQKDVLYSAGEISLTPFSICIVCCSSFRNKKFHFLTAIDAARFRLEPGQRTGAGEHVFSKFHRSKVFPVPLEAPRRALSEYAYVNGGISKSDPNPSSFRSTGDEVASKFEESAAHFRKISIAAPSSSHRWKDHVVTSLKMYTLVGKLWDRTATLANFGFRANCAPSPNFAKCGIARGTEGIGVTRISFFARRTQVRIRVLHGLDDIFPAVHNTQMQRGTIWMEFSENAFDFHFPAEIRNRARGCDERPAVQEIPA